MGDPRHDLGIAAETAVATWLEACGWRVLARRQRSPAGGEVDLVAIDPERTVVAIEVRARHTHRAGTGSETIDPRQTARIGRTLVAYALTSRQPHRGLRIDLVIATSMPGPDARWRLRRVPDIGAW